MRNNRGAESLLGDVNCQSIKHSNLFSKEVFLQRCELPSLADLKDEGVFLALMSVLEVSPWQRHEP